MGWSMIYWILHKQNVSALLFKVVRPLLPLVEKRQMSHLFPKQYCRLFLAGFVLQSDEHFHILVGFRHFLRIRQSHFVVFALKHSVFDSYSQNLNKCADWSWLIRAMVWPVLIAWEFAPGTNSCNMSVQLHACRLLSTVVELVRLATPWILSVLENA